MRVLVACEFSGVVSQAFRDKGHDAISCDYEENELTGRQYHYTGDVRDILGANWDLMIAHPPCTYLANSGVRWLTGNLTLSRDRWNKMEEASEFFYILWNANIPKVCIENPVPHKYARLPKYTQTIQPWQFGEDASKRTCLWLRGLPNLVPTNVIIKDKYANQTPSGQNKLGPSKDRAKERARTYQGIANAMAEQWG